MKKALAAVLLAITGTASAAPGDHPLKLYLERETTSLPGRVEIVLGVHDPRARPAPCAELEPFLPAGARLWGKTAIGLRCAGDLAWSTFIPVEVRVFAHAWIASRSVPAGQAPGDGDVRLEEVDLTRHPPGLLTDAVLPADKVLNRPLAPGQALRRDYLRPRPAVNAGDAVRLTYAGAGFVVTSRGKALTGAPAGQLVRVQTESGRMLMGIARGGAEVEVKP